MFNYEKFVDLCMRKILLILIVVLTASPLFSRETDSLRMQLPVLQEGSENSLPVVAPALRVDSLVDIYMERGRYQEAVDLIGQLDEPGRALLYRKSLCYIHLNRNRDAIALLSQLRENYPDDIPVRLQLAGCYETRQQYREGIECVDELIRLDSLNSYFRVKKADLLYRNGAYREALPLYREAGDYDRLYLNNRIGSCLDKMEQPDSAKVYFFEATRLDPEDSFSWMSYIRLLMKEENYIASVAYSDSFLLNNPVHLPMRSLNALAYYNMCNYPEAAKRFELCRAAGDSSLLVNRSLGISYYFMENDSLAYLRLKDAYAADTTNRQLLYALARTAHNLTYYPEAITTYEKILNDLKVDKGAMHVYHYGLAQSYDRNGEYRQAISNYITCTSYPLSDFDRNVERTMELYYRIAVICDEELNDLDTAISYYGRYGTSLYNYLIGEENKENPDPDLLSEMREKVEELDKYVIELKSRRDNLKETQKN